MAISISKVTRYAVSAAVIALVGAMGGTWMTSHPAVAAPVTVPDPAASSSTSPSPPPSPPPSSPPTAPAPPVAPAQPPPATPAPVVAAKPAPGKRELAGKLNLNTATPEQLLLLPTVGPAKAERIITWRKKNGGFKRIADLRRVKGFGYKTYKRLEPLLDITGDTTLAAK